MNNQSCISALISKIQKQAETFETVQISNQEAAQLVAVLSKVHKGEPAPVDIARIERLKLHAGDCPPQSEVVLMSNLRRIFADYADTVAANAAAIPSIIVDIDNIPASMIAAFYSAHGLNPEDLNYPQVQYATKGLRAALKGTSVCSISNGL